RTPEELAYQKPVTSYAAQKKAEQYHRHFYPKGAVGCGTTGGKTIPLVHPEGWVYAPGDTPPPLTAKKTKTKHSSRHQQKKVEAASQIDSANEAVPIVEHSPYKAGDAKSIEVGQLAKVDDQA
ncbi:hypothetical protein QBC40DRAFT_153222, partial [Triangularia verruculosa]